MNHFLRLGLEGRERGRNLKKTALQTCVSCQGTQGWAEGASPETPMLSELIKHTRLPGLWGHRNQGPGPHVEKSAPVHLPPECPACAAAGLRPCSPVTAAHRCSRAPELTHGACTLNYSHSFASIPAPFCSESNF